MIIQTYRVITREPGPHPEVGRYVPTRTHYVKADTLVDACVAANSTVGPNEVIMEISLSRPKISVSDAELAKEIEDWFVADGWDQEDIDNVGSYDGYDIESYESCIKDVVTALNNSGIVPGLAISMIADSDGYNMIKLYGFDGRYRSCGAELKHLTDDRQAVGMASLLSIAQSLIAYANTLR